MPLSSIAVVAGTENRAKGNFNSAQRKKKYLIFQHRKFICFAEIPPTKMQVEQGVCGKIRAIQTKFQKKVSYFGILNSYKIGAISESIVSEGNKS